MCRTHDLYQLFLILEFILIHFFSWSFVPFSCIFAPIPCKYSQSIENGPTLDEVDQKQNKEKRISKSNNSIRNVCCLGLACVRVYVVKIVSVSGKSSSTSFIYTNYVHTYHHHCEDCIHLVTNINKECARLFIFMARQNVEKTQYLVETFDRLTVRTVATTGHDKRPRNRIKNETIATLQEKKEEKEKEKYAIESTSSSFLFPSFLSRQSKSTVLKCFAVDFGSFQTSSLKCFCKKGDSEWAWKQQQEQELSPQTTSFFKIRCICDLLERRCFDFVCGVLEKCALALTLAATSLRVI